MATVQFEHQVEQGFQGRLGNYTATGMNIVSEPIKLSVRLSPVTTQGHTGCCFMRIHAEDLDQIIKTLQDMKSELLGKKDLTTHGMML